ncbi:hypothetical protein D9756_010040 [Leucocoprinus leucothites]|uniref:Nucleoside phosphorylase domain-containing protein n=1 Tax=Leucocoprinus leucothites TaxID=201217 RepID=A0A8H5FRX7_9AGAR|nr:hypothetical protein D9756_010040 [Leucoagaricus leucothites]
MKDIHTDANFPRTEDLRVYHLGIRPGEVANRIITVGSPSRAQSIAKFLDHSPRPFELFSERGFLTITGRYSGTPVSIVSIGMGNPNMDFFVREIRECLEGDMVVVRLGSCGALIDVPVGTVVVPEACIAVTRNYNFDFIHPDNNDGEPAYRISKSVLADQALYQKLVSAIRMAKPPDWPGPILAGLINASADSFYSSQGRQTSFPDQNSDLIEQLQASTADLATLEMETFHLYHLASCWTGRVSRHQEGAPPLTTTAVQPVVIGQDSINQPLSARPLVSGNPSMRAAAVHLVFASRLSQDFIAPDQIEQTSIIKAVLDALVGFEIPSVKLEREIGSVWEYPN